MGKGFTISRRRARRHPCQGRDIGPVIVNSAASLMAATSPH